MKVRYAAGELYSPAAYGRRRLLPLAATTLLDEETGATIEVHTDDRGVERMAVVVDGAELMSFTPADRQEETR